MSYQYITTEKKEHLFIVTINRPEVLNALSPDANFEMAAAFDDFENDPKLRVAIVTGSGDIAFSVGGDINAMVGAKVEDDYKIPDTGYGGLTSRFSCHKPIIAAVNGLALGGGFEVALASDLIIASDNAQFGLPEPQIGTAAVAGGMHRLVRQIGLKPAMAMLLTARPIDAQKALSLGLVNEVVSPEELMPSALKLAERILRCAPLAIQATKQCAMQGLNADSLEQALIAQKEHQFERLETMIKSEDIQEGINSFVEKRRPQWQGK
jgi:enoyl-CoA hydratase/carnithine racemase